MFKKSIPLLILTVILGLLSGCGSSNPYVEEAKNNLQEENYTAALESAEQSIQNMPQDPTGYYYKAVVLGQLAQEQQDPDAAADYFKKMNEAFDQAREVASEMEDEPPSEIARIEVVKSTFWRSEHNTAIEYATDDSLRNVTANPTQRAIGHLQNATLIRPDSVLTWNVLSQVHAMNQDFNSAIEAKKSVFERKENPTAKDYLELGQYYRLANQPREAVDILAEGHEKYPNEVGIIENLADAYGSIGNSEMAIETVKTLLQIDPNNSTYRLSMGTQIYETALPVSDSISVNFERIFNLQRQLRNASGSEAEELESQISNLQEINDELQTKMADLTNRAIAQLEEAIKIDSTNFDAFNTLGIIYQNEGATYFEERNVTSDNEMASKLDKQARQHLRMAMEYYERAAEIRPDAADVWQSLFSIYTSLGMDQKAQEAMKKAGIQQN